MPIIVKRDRKAEDLVAESVTEKGVNPYAVKRRAQMTNSFGCRRVVIKSDQEPPKMAFKEAVKRELKWKRQLKSHQ